MTIYEAINKIREFHGRIEGSRSDRVLHGDAEQACTGIAVTCCGTVEAIRSARALGANLLIVHEPLFYAGNDEEEKIGSVAQVAEKRRLLDECGITVWRDHDHMHAGPPPKLPPYSPGAPLPPELPRERTDYIYYGIMQVLGWENYLVAGEKKPLLFELPETDVLSLCRFLTERLNLNGVRIVGSRDAKVRRVFLCEHMDDRGDTALYPWLDAIGADVFIPLEIVDWTLSEYVRDAVALGRHKAILEMGHFNFEEAGMKYMAESWLPELLGPALPVYFVQSGDSFTYYVK